ncbi:MAG: hypothetical protein M0R70_14715 [Nitrospirae bacterium]|nr:hypothetical protein [Nitrospirota bacterium]
MPNNDGHETARLTMTPGLLGSVNVLARFMNLTPRRVQQLAKEGIIAKARPGGYDVVRCLSMYIAHLGEWRATAELPCTIADLSHCFGLTQGQVSYLVRRGVIPPPLSHGHFDLALAVRHFVAYVHQKGFVKFYGQGNLDLIDDKEGVNHENGF